MCPEIFSIPEVAFKKISCGMIETPNSMKTLKNTDFIFQRQAAFKSIDKNGDGFLSKGEVKLAFRSTSMKDINKVTNNINLPPPKIIIQSPV